jgi:hypothetical protein
MKETIENLKSITGVLLSPQSDYITIRKSCASLSAFFCRISGFEIDSTDNQTHICTDAGMAVSPYAAAYCVIDMMRTRNFLMGIKEAIDTKLKENPGKPVTVLYAGTGPFGTLLIPLTTQYPPAQLQLVMMDINPISIFYLQKIIQHQNLQPYIIDVVQADALTYIIPEKHQPDIIVSETMKPGLQKEPQVSIVANLMPQCRPNTILIPELIKVEVSTDGSINKNLGSLTSLQTLFELNAETAIRIKNNPGDVPVIAKGITINVAAPATYNHPILITTITVFNNHRLLYNESGLTIHYRIKDFPGITEYPARLLFKYQMEHEPGFRVTVI